MGAFDRATAQPVRFFMPGLDLLAEFEREFDSRRRHLLSNQHADGFIDGRPGDRLTHSCDIVIAFRLICVPVGCSSAKALLHGSDFGRGNPIHCIFSCNALELGSAKFCHPVKNTDANLCFSLLIVKMSRFEFGPDHSLPSTHLGLSATALVVAGDS
ncbi:hypothetical protein [Sinorhizobium meliloti]|uniref:hypothetical protein n=1 Tax=Rhizobium meliloti TaxID=382 RepID=UPI0018659B4D